MKPLLKLSWVGLMIAIGFVTGCGTPSIPVCTGGLCGQTVKSARAGYIAPERVADVMDVPVAGKVTVIDFWDTHCPPCVVAMPGWNDLWHRMDVSKAIMVGVSMDDSIADAREGLRNDKRLQVAFPMLHDSEALVLDDIYQLGAVRPITIVVDETGRVVFDSRHTTGDAQLEVEKILTQMGALK